MIESFKNRSRVAFIGDSLTAANISLQWIIKAYRGLDGADDVRFFNCGVAGGTADFAVKSYARDILRYRPTHAVISFGINDSRRELLLEARSPERHEALVRSFEKYKRSLAALVSLLQLDGVEVILCTPVPYDEYSEGENAPLPGGYALMLGYAEYVRRLADVKGVTLYDQHAILSRLMEREQIHSPDRIHMTNHGYYVLAREFLKAQGVAAPDEDNVSSAFDTWHSYVARLRKVLAAECMLVPRFGEDVDSPTEVKLVKMHKMIDDEAWGAPVLESFCRAYMADKPLEEELYRLVDESYEDMIRAL
jgi:lysophospholipase L1-like esterase